MDIDKEIEAIGRGEQPSHDAALALGLLLERQRRPGDAMNDEIRLISGEGVASRHLSPAEADLVLNHLLSLIDSTLLPKPVLVWAVSRSADPRIVGPLSRLLDRTLSSPESLDVAREALSGLMLFDGEEAAATIRRVAESDRGELGDAARSYAERHSPRP